MKILALIPARMGSSRFPGKPMELINGIPMIGHVYKNICNNRNLTRIVVATCDEIIFNYIKDIGGEAVMTSKKHNRATDRCAEALKKIEKKDRIKFDIIVMIQGDEPMVNSNMINKALEPLKNNKKIGVVNLLCKFENLKEFLSPNTIKVICDKNSDAIYFTRNLNKKFYYSDNLIIGKQVCIMPFRREFLKKYIKLNPTFLERHESIDMWRFIEHGYSVKMKKINDLSFAVDTKNDLKKVENLIKKN